MCINRIILTLAVLIALSTTVFSQTKISGSVFAGKFPLEGASVLVLKAPDSSYIAGTITDSTGSFSFRGLKSGHYIFSFSRVGYKTKCLNLLVEDNTCIKQTEIILEKENFLLGSVIIRGKYPPFKHEAGKTTVNVSSITLGSDGSVLNILNKIPGVSILSDGTVLLNGQAGANVMIDDKLTYLSGENLVNFLRSIPSGAVDKIELISQPSARYDANGTSGFINIQRRKKTDQGLNGWVSSNIETGKRLRQNQSTSINFHRGKTSIYADYSFYSGKDFMFTNSSRKYFDKGQADPTGLRLDMNANRFFTSRSHYIKLGIDYEFSQKLHAGAHLYSNWFQRNKEELATSDFFHGSTVSDSTLNTVNWQQIKHNNFSGEASLTYKGTKKLKWESWFNFQLFNENDALDQTNSLHIPDKPDQPGALLGTTGDHINIYNGQTNLNYDVSNNLKLSTGLKSSWVKINSEALYKTKQSGQWQTDESLSSGFIYNENINAGYLQVNKKWSSAFSSEMGLRLEHTGVSGYYTSGKKDSVLNRSYLYAFPAFTVSYLLKNDQSVSFQYGRRIVRPNYRDMNPFIEVSDRFLQQKGNTQLNPELVDNFEATWLIKSRYAFVLFYSGRKNPITASFLVDSVNKSTIVMPLNLLRSHSAGFRASLNSLKPVKWWTAHVSLSLIYKQFHWKELSKAESDQLFTPTVQFNNQFSLPYNWSLEATGYYNGPMVEGQAKTGSLWSVSVGARRNLLRDKISLYIYANDIFLTNRPHKDLRNMFIEGVYNERRDTRMIGVTATYRFNSGSKAKEFRKMESTEESKRANL